MKNNILQNWRHLNCSLPEGWRNDRVKDLVSLRQEKINAQDDNEDYIELEDIESGTGRLLFRRDTLDVESAVTLFKKGDILFGKLRPYLEKYYYADFDGKCTGEIIAFEPRRIEGHFFYYFVASKDFIDKCDALSYGAKMPRVNWPTQIAYFDVPIPVKSEQKGISTYLDEQCATINKVIEIKKEQLAILEDLRKSIIHKVVTRGLNDDVKLVDSGIDWIGEVPKHWQKEKLFRICQLVSSGGTPNTFEPDYYDGDIIWVQTGDLNDGYIETTEKMITRAGLESSSAKLFPKGTLIIALYGATIGKLGVLKQESATNQACCAMIFYPWMNTKYFYYLFFDCRDTLISLGYGGGQNNISQRTIKQTYFYFPKYAEQIQIVEYLDKECDKIEKLRRNIQNQINVLTLYRKSLIHECVTGKRRITEQDLKDLADV